MSLEGVLGQGLLPVCYIRVHCRREASDETSITDRNVSFAS